MLLCLSSYFTNTNSSPKWSQSFLKTTKDKSQVKLRLGNKVYSVTLLKNWPLKLISQITWERIKYLWGQNFLKPQADVTSLLHQECLCPNTTIHNADLWSNWCLARIREKGGQEALGWSIYEEGRKVRKEKNIKSPLASRDCLHSQARRRRRPVRLPKIVFLSFST